VRSQLDGTYQHKAELRRQARRPTSIHPGAFSLVGTIKGPHLPTKKSPDEGRFSRGGAQGKIIHPSFSSPSSSSSPVDSDSEGVSPPPRAFATARAMPLRHSFYFCVRCLLFSVLLASRLAISSSKVTPHELLCIHPRLYNCYATKCDMVEAGLMECALEGNPGG
jgi:hypothetical protein